MATENIVLPHDIQLFAVQNVLGRTMGRKTWLVRLTVLFRALASFSFILLPAFTNDAVSVSVYAATIALATCAMVRPSGRSVLGQPALLLADQQSMFGISRCHTDSMAEYIGRWRRNLLVCMMAAVVALSAVTSVQTSMAKLCIEDHQIYGRFGWRTWSSLQARLNEAVAVPDMNWTANLQGCERAFLHELSEFNHDCALSPGHASAVKLAARSMVGPSVDAEMLNSYTSAVACDWKRRFCVCSFDVGWPHTNL